MQRSIPPQTAIAQLLGRYALPAPDSLVALDDAGGFSGALLWRATIGPAQFCLRRWPETRDPQRLMAIFQLLQFVVTQGLRCVPAPLTTGSGTPVVMHAGHCWSLEPWLPGRADVSTPPGEVRLTSAMQTLARFHVAAAVYRPLPTSDGATKSEFSLAATEPSRPPGLQQRIVRLQHVLSSLADQIAAAEVPPTFPELRQFRAKILPLVRQVGPLLLPHLQSAANVPVPLQASIRDIWSAHVLFTGDDVTGIVDFDAMRIDNVATDLARLLGSYAADDADAWQRGLAAYHSVRPLSEAERILLECYDRSAVLLTGIQWLEWLLLNRRTFPRSDVYSRLAATAARLEHLSGQIRTSLFNVDR